MSRVARNTTISRDQSSKGFATRLFAANPELKKEIRRLNLRYSTTMTMGYGTLMLFEEGKYRHIFWCPGARGTGEYQPYYVYIPPTAYTFHTVGKKLSLTFGESYQVKGAASADRNTMIYNVAPNEECLGGQSRDYSPARNNLENIIETYWATGFNNDMGLTQFHYNVYCYNETKSNTHTNLPDVSWDPVSYELFEKWQSLSPEEVMLCAQLQWGEIEKYML